MKPYRIQRGGRSYWAAEIPAPFLPLGARRTVVMAATKADVETRWMARVQEHVRGLDVEGGQKTLSEFLREFLDLYASRDDIERSTVEDYRFHITQHIEPEIGRIPLHRFGVNEVDEFLRALRAKTSARTGRKLSARTVHYAYAVLRLALQYAVDYHYIASNPASARMRRSRLRWKSSSGAIRFFNTREAKRFLQAVEGDRDEGLYVLAMTTGLRKGELLGLQWRDVDLDAARLTVNHSLQFTKRRSGTDEPRWILKGPKTAQSRRTIELPSVAIDALRRHRIRQDEMRELAGPEWKDLGYVFTSSLGTPLDTGNALHRFQTLCERAGLPRIRFYDLRHTHASLLIHEGVHAKKIAERLGHSSIKLTMDTYGHLFDGTDRESAQRMDEIFGATPQRAVETGESKASNRAVREGARRPARGTVVVMPARRTG